jgi:hypothetical protein
MILIVTAENRALYSAELAEVDRQQLAVPCHVAIDRDAAILLIAKAAPALPVLASVRLTPTDETHALWEAAGFWVAPEVRVRRARNGLLWELICGVLEAALLFGVERVRFATNAALAPLMLEFGWGSETISITPDGLKNVRRHVGVHGPATRFVPATTSVVASRAAPSIDWSHQAAAANATASTCGSWMLRTLSQYYASLPATGDPDSARRSHPG